MKIWVAVPALLIGLALAGCGDNSTIAKNPFSPLGATEVLQNVYDDQQSTAYIKVDRTSWGEDAALADIMAKKKEWERQFPAKKVVAMSVVTGYGRPIVVGLLIHYEQR